MEFRFKHSVLGTYEINDAPLVKDYIDVVANKFDYLDTSICYNNDYFLKTILKKNKKMKVISKIPPQMVDKYDWFVTHHLRCLGRKKIDIMLIHNPRSDWHDLAVFMNKDKRFVEVGVSNFNIDQLNEYRSLIGKYPAYNEMEINPNYYDKELIEFCHKNNIKLIAYAILGGKYNARRNIATYTMPYLLSFAAYNAEMVILRSDNYTRLYLMDTYLHEIMPKSTFSVSFDNVEAKTDKSILPTEYRYPKYYTRAIHPTNSDKVILGAVDKGMTICNGFYDSDDNEKTDVFKFSEDINHPWEFISDFRAYFRYRIDEEAKKMTGDYPTGMYIGQSIYVAKVKKKGWNWSRNKMKGRYFTSCINLLTPDGNLSKVNDGKSKFIIETDYKEI